VVALRTKSKELPLSHSLNERAGRLAFVGSLILLKLVDATVGLRVATDDERMGLDLSEHEEAGYSF